MIFLLQLQNHTTRKAGGGRESLVQYVQTVQTLQDRTDFIVLGPERFGGEGKKASLTMPHRNPRSSELIMNRPKKKWGEG